MCIVRAIEQIIKTKKDMDKLKQTEFEQLLAVRKVLSQVNNVKVLKFWATKLALSLLSLNGLLG